MKQLLAAVFSCLLILFSFSCTNSNDGDNPDNRDMSETPGYAESGYGYDQSTNVINFLDSVSSNADLKVGIAELTFVNPEGKSVKPVDLAADKNLVLVIIRGFTTPICPFCSTQTSRLISNYEKFSKRNAEVVIVYPVENPQDTTHWDDFLADTRMRLDDPKKGVPFPVLFDVELKAVSQLGLRKNLSKPATYILDQNSDVRFAYIGATMADRPSINAMLEQLDQINSENSPDTPTEPETED